MAAVYWQGVGSTVFVGDFWGQGGNPDGYWSAEPADGDTIIMGRGAEVIVGDPLPLVEVAEFRVGHGFTGAIGTSAVPLAVASYSTWGVFRINSGGDVHLHLVDDASTAQNGTLVIDVTSGTVTVVDDRTLSQKISPYTHTIDVIMRSASAAVTISRSAGGGQPAYSRVVASGRPGSQLTLTGTSATTIYTDGCDVNGGTASDTWVVASGNVEPYSAGTLLVYGGTVTPGLHGSGGDFGYMELHGGRLDLASVESDTTLPDSWDDVVGFSGTIETEGAQPVVNRGAASVVVGSGTTLSVENAEE